MVVYSTAHPKAPGSNPGELVFGNSIKLYAPYFNSAKIPNNFNSHLAPSTWVSFLTDLDTVLQVFGVLFFLKARAFFSFFFLVF